MRYHRHDNGGPGGAGAPLRPPPVRLFNVAAGAMLLTVYGAAFFGAAGRVDLPAAWALLGIWFAGLVGSTAVMPAALLEERLRPRRPPRERWFRPSTIMLFLVLLVVAGADVGRLHAGDTVPRPLQAAALAAAGGIVAVVVGAQRANPFFSSVVRIQRDRGQQVVSAGPYRWVRHPAYAAFMWMPLCCGIALGSWLSLAVFPFACATLVARTAVEDRLLRAELRGYEAYAKRVRYRLLPGVW